ncbi:MAG: VCBS repeat-containing protein [Cyclobacteriaceae bacterium]|nr:VCBS repeat-containing protein [Cyclobacteriaceae bacterium]MDH4295934.1 VCBS repeat-containing protein [Cyclobacteriaceae bacterium]MDH5249440.1 VCBS repeat-containing protein [Cyclobacteriaceae bacterium]
MKGSTGRGRHKSYAILSKLLYLAVPIALSAMLPLRNVQAQALTNHAWSVKYAGIGIFSSPRVTDLNGDGIGDIVIGAGRKEFHACDSAVIALNGVNGEMLWCVSSVDHIYGSASLKDLNGDGIMDIVIGGRSAELMAINGRDGKIIWKFDKKSAGIDWYNFYNAQFIKDQDGDGMEDVLISNGGNVLAAPYETKNRYPGNLAVLSGKDGKLLARAPMPDGKETYMSVVAVPISGSADYKVVFGSGGETIGGHLYITTLSEIFKGDLSKAIILDSSPDKGYIGPPLLIDINHDGTHDIVANAVEGKMMAFDGKTYKPIWSIKMPGTEAYSSIAPGYFTGADDVPDFFVSYAVGQWPDLGWSRQFMVNGATGKVAYLDSLGSYQTSTPVVIDLNADGIDEAILNVNVVSYDIFDVASFHNILVVMDFKENQVVQLWDGHPGSNISSTPWIGDLDSDGQLDIIYCHGRSTKKTYSFDGLQVNRVTTGLPIKSAVRWGAYMGSSYNGVYEGNK